MTDPLLLVSYEEQLHKYSLTYGKEKQVIIGASLSSTMTFTTLNETLEVNWDGDICHIEGETLSAGNKLVIEKAGGELSLFLLSMEHHQTFDTTRKKHLTFGLATYDDIQVKNTTSDVVLQRGAVDHDFTVHVNQGTIFHNFTAVDQTAQLHIGDQLFFDGLLLFIGAGDITVIMEKAEAIVHSLTPLHKTENKYENEYPDYHRSPRIIYREPDEKRVIANPSAKPSKPSEQLMRMIIPPIVMIAAFSLVTIFQPRGIYIIVMLAMTVTTVIMSIISYVKNVKKYRLDMKERVKSYKAYLQRKTAELHRATGEQRHARDYHFPDVKQIRDMATDVHARIFEKTMFHHDFLTYRVGLGDIAISFEIDFKEAEFTQDEDELIEEAEDLFQQFNRLSHVPITTTFMNGPVGYIGQRHLVLEQLQLVMMQIAFFHSYHDVQSIVIFPEEEKKEWEWMRWLPHARLKELNVRGFVYHERSRDQVLNSLFQILKTRKQMISEQDKQAESYFAPHYLIIITDEKIILDHTVMEFLNEDPRELGVSLVFVEDVLQSLPEHVKTVIDIKDAKNGNVLLEEGELVNQHFIPDHFPDGFNKEALSRALAPLNHLQGLKSSIPEAVTFLEMYGIEKVDQLPLESYWRQNETYKSLAVPLGLRAKDDIVYLNLHEKAHGPHGLVAGTTGSGKSEIIQSYILSLAVHFHPYEVAFLLIDYKGGGMANLFNDLPHLLGTITNLDGAASLRALASIKAELKRRQRLFGEHDVNHINQYQKLFKLGEATEPMPHLFLISDEFAELKAEQPDFMKELVSTARIGRSLGIHLILATQKPSGVVDDQIWSNSKFKLALKVQNESDSKEILKTPDAAEITLPGRAYLQVGNNEIYELFQSAWSGADYHPDKDDLEVVDTTVYAINELGQYNILTKDLSGLEHKATIEKTTTELEAIIEHIHQFTMDENIDPLPSPWLPPLDTRIYLPELVGRTDETMWQDRKQPLEAVIGMVDLPDEQSQRKLSLPLTKDGHLAVFSSPGYGKSTFLQTVVMDVTRVHHPAQLHLYLLDFGTNGLLPLKGVPHVADTILIDESEKIGKLLRRLDTEMKARKKLLSAYGVATMEMYEQASGETIPHIMMVLDNYDAVREADFVEPFEKVITQIAREGSSIGIHLVISASRQNVLRVPLLSNVKTQVALFLIDELEARSIVGRTQLKGEEIPGRGLIKLDDVVAFQTALPVVGKDTLAIIEAIQAEAHVMDKAWDGDRPEAIPMMPEDAIDFAAFKERKATKQLVEKNILPLGLEFETVTPLPFDFQKMKHLIAVGDRLDRVEKLQVALVKNMSLLADSYKTMLIDTTEQKLAGIEADLNSYISKHEQFTTLKKDLLTEVAYRNEHKDTNPPWLIMVANFKEFTMHSMMKDEEITTLMHAANVGIHFIICSEYSYLGQSYEQIPKYVRNQALAGLICMRLGDQDLFKQRFISNEPVLENDECYFAMDHHYTKLKLPR